MLNICSASTVRNLLLSWWVCCILLKCTFASHFVIVRWYFFVMDKTVTLVWRGGGEGQTDRQLYRQTDRDRVRQIKEILRKTEQSIEIGVSWWGLLFSPDFDECSTWGYCDQLCENKRASYECSCRRGYTLEGTRTCRAADSESSSVKSHWSTAGNVLFPNWTKWF